VKNNRNQAHLQRMGIYPLLLIASLLLTACGGGMQPGETPISMELTQPAGDASPLPLEETPVETDSGSTDTPPTTEETPTDAAAAPTDTDAAGDGGGEFAPAATNFPDPAGYQWVALVSGLQRPVGLTFAPDGRNRLFVIEQPGRIRIIQDGVLLETPFLDITDRVNDSGNEQGLLGLAFHPTFPDQNVFYVNYTGDGGTTYVSRFSVSEDVNIAMPDSEEVILTQEQPFPNHNGGGVVFGPDGYLYLSLGDGGSGGDPQGNAQNTQTLLGKLLRIDVNSGDTYTIPADNPFANGGGRAEIWAYGLRNPWRFSFDRKTSDIFIADVGQNQWEEIDIAPAGVGGLNFGWDYREGMHEFEGTPPADLTLTDPVHEYGREAGCSVTGGHVYRGQALPEWNGVYFFGDFCTGFVFGLIPMDGQPAMVMPLWQTGAGISSFGEDAAGEIYLLDINAGEVLMLQKP